MFNLILEISNTVLLNILQLMAGFLLSIPIYFVDAGKSDDKKHSLPKAAAIIALSSVMGIALPMGLYGLVPLVYALRKYKLYITVPAILSNSMFNMLIPFTDPTFVIRTGYTRIILAVIMGVLSGIIIYSRPLGGKSAFRFNSPDNRFVNIFGAFAVFKDIMSHTGAYLIIGIILNTVFQEFILFNTMSFLYTNTYTSFIPHFFSIYDVVSPTFLLTMSIITMLMDLTRLSALLCLFKAKGFILTIVNFAVWALLLALPTFL